MENFATWLLYMGATAFLLLFIITLILSLIVYKALGEKEGASDDE